MAITYTVHFAGTVLEEEANNWFKMDRLKSSPFMTYAIPVLEDKLNQIPAITHVDNTCRIQTVNFEQNLKYYQLIKEFYRLTNVPIVLNTSLNNMYGIQGDWGMGEPMCETPEDAISALINTDIDYIYFADKDVLVN